MGVLFTARSNSSVRVRAPRPVREPESCRRPSTRQPASARGGRRRRPRAPRNCALPVSALNFTPSTVPPVTAKSDCDDRIVARAANLRARVEHAGERAVSEEQLVDVLHLHVVEPQRSDCSARLADAAPIATVPAAVTRCVPRCRTKFSSVTESFEYFATASCPCGSAHCVLPTVRLSARRCSSSWSGWNTTLPPSPSDRRSSSTIVSNCSSFFS